MVTLKRLILCPPVRLLIRVLRGINKEEDIWHITVEITEKPSEAINLEVLGIYDVRVDASENLIGFERIGMRKRGDIR
jgi:ribosomal protein S16